MFNMDPQIFAHDTLAREDVARRLATSKTMTDLLQIAKVVDGANGTLGINPNAEPADLRLLETLRQKAVTERNNPSA